MYNHVERTPSKTQCSLLYSQRPDLKSIIQDNKPWNSTLAQMTMDSVYIAFASVGGFRIWDAHEYRKGQLRVPRARTSVIEGDHGFHGWGKGRLQVLGAYAGVIEGDPSF